MKPVNFNKVLTTCGQEIARVNGLLLHSKYNPIQEAEKNAQSNYEPHCLHVVFGYGNGYLIDALVKEFKFNENILVVDPLIDLGYLEFKNHEKIEHLYYWSPNSINTLAFTLGQIAPVRDTKIKVIVSNHYNNIFPTELKSLLEGLKESQTRSLVNKNTLIIFGETWQRNFVGNLKNLIEDEPIQKLKKYYSCPVVMVSGGPSLTKQLSQLKLIRDNIIIVCAGSTINSLLAVDIEPDYVLSIDGGEPNYNHFKALKLDYADLVYTPTSHYQIRKCFSRRAFTLNVSDRKNVEEYLKEKFNYPLQSLIGGGTVAHYALSFSKYITSGPIAMIGQDLAFTNNQSHALNNKNFESMDDLTNTLEVDGYNGDKVKTSGAFFAMIKSFEEMNKFYPHENKLFNCTEGGAKLKGYEEISFKDFCTDYVEKIKVERFNLNQKNLQSNERLKKVWNDELRVYSKLEKIINDALNELGLIKGTMLFSNQTITLLDKIDKQILFYLKEIQMDFILTPLALEVEEMFLEKLNETEQEKFNRVFKQSETLYDKLIELVIRCKKIVEKAIKNL